MAARKSFLLPRPNFLHFTNPQRDDSVFPDDPFEFDESDLWSAPSSNPPSETKIPKPISKKPIVKSTAAEIPKPAAASLPVNIPDWSSILRDADHLRFSLRKLDGGGGDSGCGSGDDGDDDRECRVPPHEYLARTRRASFSVHEGIGRTLKGRDLRRVRNAIWKKTGFED